MPLTPQGELIVGTELGWRTWWQFNGDAYLGLSARLDEVDRRTHGGDGFGLGRGEREQSNALDVAQVRQHVVPALWVLIREGGDQARMRAALLALARVEANWSVKQGLGIGATAASMLASGDQQAAESTIVGLGVAGQREGIETLLELVSDSPTGRTLSKSDSVDYRRRSLAAFGLALAMREHSGIELRRRVVDTLITTLKDGDTAPYDLQLACLVALGLVQVDDHADAQQADDADVHLCLRMQAQFLTDYVRDERRHPRLRGQALIPLARVAARLLPEHRTTALELLLTPLEANSKAPSEAQQCAAIALGLVADCDSDALDERSRDVLLRAATKGDRLTRGLALIALGKVGARRGTGAGSDKAQREIREVLLTQVSRGQDDRRAWGALALAVLGHDCAEARLEIPDELGPAVRAALTGARSPDDAAAACLALAVLRDRQAAQSILATFEATREEGLRACAAMSLGWVDANAAIDPLAALLGGGPRQGQLFGAAATSLRLLGNATAVPGLLEHLQIEAARKSGDGSGALACVTLLGKLGDPRALTPLRELASDPALEAKVRACAATALADLCDQKALHWTSAISTDFPFSQLSSTLVSYSANGTGLLEMR